MSLVTRAREFAAVAHGDQKRKYSGRPYVTHTQEVAEIVAHAGGDPEMVAAAHLHDVLEDTAITFEEVRGQFGAAVADLVLQLTDQVPRSYGARTARKHAEADRLARCDDRAKTVKLADVISNTRSIEVEDPDFARIYLAEMRYLVPRLAGGSPQLHRRACKVVGLKRSAWSAL